MEKKQDDGDEPGDGDLPEFDPTTEDDPMAPGTSLDDDGSPAVEPNEPA